MTSLNRMPHNTKYLLLIIFFSFSIYAQNSVEKISINPNWSDLTEQQYIDNLAACEDKMQAFKWSKNLWPKENKEPKPVFSEVVNLNHIAEKVHNRLKMQSLLLERFNIEITQSMLQHDLNRMAQNTKDTNGLKELFQLFDNNPQTIAECISLPYLIQDKTTNSYNWHNEIHAPTKELAETELELFQKYQKANVVSVKPQTVTFKIKSEDIAETEKSLDEELVIELEPEAFTQKSAQLEQAVGLQETDFGFVYQEILAQTEDHIAVKTLFWQKQSIESWLTIQADDYLIRISDRETLTLPVITANQQKFEEKSVS